MLRYSSAAVLRPRALCATLTAISSTAAFTTLLAFAAGAASVPAMAAETVELKITIKNHKFEPAEIKVPAKTAVMLKVTNLDKTPEEFESKVLDVEKVITAGGTGTIRLKPLAAGRYPFVGEFHEDTAKGTIVAE